MAESDLPRLLLLHLLVIGWAYKSKGDWLVELHLHR